MEEKLNKKIQTLTSSDFLPRNHVMHNGAILLKHERKSLRKYASKYIS